MKINAKCLTRFAVSLVFLAVAKPAFAQEDCNEIQFTEPPIPGAVYYFQRGMKAPERIKIQTDVSLLNKIEDYKKAISLSGDLPYCLFFSYASDLVKKNHFKQYGVFFSSHYFYLNLRNNKNVVFRNFGKDRELAFRKTYFIDLINGQQIPRNIQSDLDYNLLFALKDGEGNSIEFNTKHKLFRRFFTIPNILNHDNIQHVFEFTRFREKQDKKTRMVKKDYASRKDLEPALYQVVYIKLLKVDPEKNRIGPLFWVIKFHFSNGL